MTVKLRSGCPKRARYDMIVATLLLLGLAMPFVTFPWDGLTKVDVAFRTAAMSGPQAFTAVAPLSVCRVLALSLEYEDPATGEYTRIACAE